MYLQQYVVDVFVVTWMSYSAGEYFSQMWVRIQFKTMFVIDHNFLHSMKTFDNNVIYLAYQSFDLNKREKQNLRMQLLIGALWGFI